MVTIETCMNHPTVTRNITIIIITVIISILDSFESYDLQHKTQDTLPEHAILCVIITTEIY